VDAPAAHGGDAKTHNHLIYIAERLSVDIASVAAQTEARQAKLTSSSTSTAKIMLQANSAGRPPRRAWMPKKQRIMGLAQIAESGSLACTEAEASAQAEKLIAARGPIKDENASPRRKDADRLQGRGRARS
jgi:hypothetical protein